MPPAAAARHAKASGVAKSRATSSSTRDPEAPGTPGHQARAEKERRDQVRGEEKMFQDIYEDGQRDARREAKAKSDGGAKSAAQRAGTRAAGSATRSTKRFGRDVNRAVAGPVASASSVVARMVGTTVLLSALLLVLRNAGAVSNFLNGARKGLDWLKSPVTAIPYHD